jgi:hypothetical protein
LIRQPLADFACLGFELRVSVRAWSHDG